MALSGLVPWDSLPGWMYHAQIPPPDRVFNHEIPGITWVDLVFPFFLFAMGAAIPLSLPRRIEQGAGRALLFLLARFGLLFAFALAVEHGRLHRLGEMSEPGPRLQALLLFALTAAAWMRWPWRQGKWINLAAGAGLAAAFVVMRWQGEPFDPARQDIILMVLAHVALTGSAAWWLTRKRPMSRMAAAAAMIVWLAASPLEGWPADVWNWTPLKWAYQFQFQKYLAVVLFGTILGDALALGSEKLHADCSWKGLASGGLALAALGLITHLLWLDLPAWCLPVALLGGGGAAWLVRANPLRARIVLAGLGLVLLGLIAEPLGGGIKKDHATPGYLLLASGLAFWAWHALRSTREHFPQGRRGLFEAAGANPMLAYLLISGLNPVLWRALGVEGWVGNQGWSPWALAGWAAFQTLAILLLAAGAGRLRLFMRA